jgi:hypothetical protein
LSVINFQDSIFGNSKKYINTLTPATASHADVLVYCVLCLPAAACSQAQLLLQQ